MSLYLVLTRLLRDESTLTNLVFTAAVVLAPLSLVLPDVWRTPSVRSLALMATIGLLGLGVLYALDRALELAPTSVVAPALYAQPVFAVVLATAAGELHLGRAAELGSVLVVAVYAVLFMGIRWHRTDSAPRSARQVRARS